jgi:diadenosine tetraphosphatase ApaH/serine/threonine PP2A family protein phosphatase
MRVAHRKNPKPILIRRLASRIAKPAADRIVLTGDLASGPMPVPTLDLLTVVLDIAGLGRTLFCHATPRDDEEVALVDSRMVWWRAVLSTVDDDVTTIVCGHTHMPFVRLVDRRLVVNPGSVGMPYGSVGGHWALLGPGTGVALRRTVFDVDAACARIAAESGYPGAARWADEYVRAEASDAEALEVFGPRDGREPALGLDQQGGSCQT